jgi:hypothetical protein
MKTEDELNHKIKKLHVVVKDMKQEKLALEFWNTMLQQKIAEFSCS